MSMALLRPLVVTALTRRALVPRRCHLHPMCSAADGSASSPIPDWMLAPPELQPEWVACAISHFEVEALNNLKSQAPKEGVTRLEEVPSSVTCDIGMRRPTAIDLTPHHVQLHLGESNPVGCVDWKFLAKVVKKQKEGAWQLDSDCDEQPELIRGYSEDTHRSASLLPVASSPPTAVLGGFGMHRFKSVTPGEDTSRKLGALGQARGGLRGRVLDVCTGLGYTCLGAARTPNVDEVVTIELDSLMVEIQRANPWSEELFTHQKVTRLLGDATELLPQLPSDYFGLVMHDPPANSMSGELYSAQFYAELHRVLKDGGSLYHYVGDPASKASGKLFKGILERMRSVGFTEVKTVSAAYGIVAKCSKDKSAQ